MTLRKWYDKYDENYFLDVIDNGKIIYTSGSSGTPKAIFNGPTKILNDAKNAIKVQEINKESVILTVLNPERAGALFAQTIPGLIAGATIDLVKFNPYDYVRVASNYTHTHLTPKQAKAVMMTKGFKNLDLSDKIFLIGSEPVTWDIIDAFMERGATVITIWGMSEIGVNAIMHIFKNHSDVAEAKKIAPKNTTILGNILHCEWKIGDNDCLWVKGDISTYDDWFNTEDQVVLDSINGWLWYSGRYGTPVDFDNPKKDRMKIKNTYDVIILTEGSDPKLGVTRSIGGYKIASALRNAGYSVFVLHNFSHFIRKGNITKILDCLIGKNTLWVGFSSTLFMVNRKDIDRKLNKRDGSRNNILWTWPFADKEPIIELTNYIRKKGIKTVYGGQADHTRVKEVSDIIDYFVVGIGETAAIDLSNHLRYGSLLYYNLEYGTNPMVLDYDRNGNNFDFRNSLINYVPEDFWLPDDAMGIEFGRGCIFKCKFCAYPLIGKSKNDMSYLRTKESIKHELKQNYEMFGTTRYVIADDTFNERTDKLQIIADAIEELDLNLQFSAYIRIDLVARFPEQIDLLRRINVCSWFLGIESLNPQAAKTIGKGIQKNEIYKTVLQAKKVFNDKLNVFGSFIVGLPYDDPDTINHWITELIEREDIFDSFTFSPLELNPSSELFKHANKYRYSIDESTNNWSSDHWTSQSSLDYTMDIQQKTINRFKISTFFLMFYQCLGFSFEELSKMTFHELSINSEIQKKAKEYSDRYYSIVENFIGVS